MKIIGHRGARGLAPENTIASLRAGIASGASGVEFDVRITKDGIPVLIHDNALEAADGSEYHVHAHTLEQLQAKKSDLCTLSAGLRAIDRRAQALIELKPGIDPSSVVTVVRRLLVEGWKPTDFAFLSFDFRILRELHAALPEVPIIVNEMWSSVRAVWRARQLKTKQIDILYKVLWPGVIRSLHRHGYEVYTFALNDVEKARRWQACGLAGVITDYPDRLQTLAGPHNPWIKGS